MPAYRSRSLAEPSFVEWYKNPFIQPLTSSDSLGWNGLSLHTSVVEATKDDVSGPTAEDHALIIQLIGSTRLQTWFDGKFYDEYMTPGSIGLVPAHHASRGRWSDPITAAFVNLSPRLLTTIADATFCGDPEHVQLLPALNFRDPFLHHLITALYNELQNPGRLGTLFVDSVSQTIMLHLLRKYSTAVVTLHQPLRGHFTPQQMRILKEYIDQHLDQKISLSDLASLLHLSVSHFERSFRAALGAPPYRYVLERRMERAKLLLYNRDLSLYEIARLCGFANQSHFTKHFTQIVGVSPARFAALAQN